MCTVHPCLLVKTLTYESLYQYKLYEEAGPKFLLGRCLYQDPGVTLTTLKEVLINSISPST